MRRFVRSLALATTTALMLSVLAACGASDAGASSPDTPTAPASTAPASTGPASTGPASTAPSSAAPSAPAPSSSAPRSVTITIADFGYSAVPAVAPGTRITVTNKDAEAHSVTADSAGGFDVSVPPGTSRSFTAPKKSGAFPFHCIFHADMHGMLTVR